MSMQAPLTQVRTFAAAAVAGGADATTPAVEAPFDGTVTGVAYVPAATITGAATNNRTLSLVNKGQTGAGTTVVASLNFGNGTNAAAFDERDITLSVTAADLVVAAEDELAWLSTHIGTGIADPGGRAEVTFARS